MSGRKRQGADLLVRLRYQNPLPLPPFGPKTLHCETDLGRFGKDYQTLRSLENDRPVAFVADGEVGMPLDLGNANAQHEYFSGHRASVEFDPSQPAPELDPEDEDLCMSIDEPVAGSSTGMMKKNSLAATKSQARTSTSNVSWLRRPEMFDAASARSTILDRSGSNTPVKKQAHEKLTPAEKRKLVASGFDAASRSLEELKHPHPAKRHLKAVSSVPILPDEQIWGNSYHLYRFPDHPGGAPELLERALIRTVTMPDGSVRMAHYFADGEHEIDRFNEVKRTKLPADLGDPNQDHVLEESEEAHIFKHQKDYEPAQFKQLNSEFLLSVDAGSEVKTDEGDGLTSTQPEQRLPGAYYTNLDSIQALKRRRPKRGENPDDYGPLAAEMNIQPWHIIRGRLGLAPSVMGEMYDQRKQDLAGFQPPEALNPSVK